MIKERIQEKVNQKCLDLYGRPHEKFIRFIGEKGTILWSVDPNRISVSENMEQKWEHEDFTCDRNSMFLGVAKEFISILEGDPIKTCDLHDGVLVMEVIEAVRNSQQKQKLFKFI